MHIELFVSWTVYAKYSQYNIGSNIIPNDSFLTLFPYYFLIDLGEDEEAQLQNLILRALGQIMLYVDGMNGVMENPRAIQFLYKLVLASNPLVCKTAIKLLLVFVEYTENNCLLLIKAINEVDKELGVIPWSNIITTIQNANKDSTKRIGNYQGIFLHTLLSIMFKRSCFDIVG